MEKYGQKFSELTRLEKRQYIWEYYKLHIIGSLLAIYLIGAGLNHYVINPPATITFDVTILTRQINETMKNQLNDYVVDLAYNPEKNETGGVEHLAIAQDQNPQMMQAMVTKVAAKSSLNDFDVLLIGPHMYDQFASEGVFYSLDQVFTEEESKLYADYLQESDQGQWVLEVSDLAYFQELTLEEAPLYLTIHSQTDALDKSKALIQYLMSQ